MTEQNVASKFQTFDIQLALASSHIVIAAAVEESDETEAAAAGAGGGNLSYIYPHLTS